MRPAAPAISASATSTLKRPRRQVERDDVAVAHGGDRAAGGGFRRDVAGHQPVRGAGEAAVGDERDRVAEAGADDRRR